MSAILGRLLSQVLADPLIAFIIIVVFGFLGLIMLLIYSSKVRADRQSRLWPAAPGRIEHSKIEERTSRAYNAGSGNRFGGASPRYVPQVTYSDAVNGTRYEGDRIGNGIYVGWTRGFADRWVKRYPVGAAVNIYYDPTAPSNAVLERTDPGNMVGLLGAVVLTAAVLWFAALTILRLTGL